MRLAGVEGSRAAGPPRTEDAVTNEASGWRPAGATGRYGRLPCAPFTNGVDIATNWASGTPGAVDGRYHGLGGGPARE